MGPTGLTAVFGMGTGGTPPVWSPERRPAGGQAAPAATIRGGSGTQATPQSRVWWGARSLRRTRVVTLLASLGVRIDFAAPGSAAAPRGGARRADRGGQAFGC